MMGSACLLAGPSGWRPDDCAVSDVCVLVRIGMADLDPISLETQAGSPLPVESSRYRACAGQAQSMRRCTQACKQ